MLSLEMSVNSLITKLCSSLAADIEDVSTKEKLLRKMKARAFEILLSNRNGVFPDDQEAVGADYLTCEIQGHIYWDAKESGGWCSEMNEAMLELVKRTELALQVEPAVAPVLRLLCHLAHSAPSGHPSQKASYGLDMSTLISDRTLKYNPLVRGSRPVLIPEIMSITELAPDTRVHPRLFQSTPGSGLRHPEFFCPPEMSQELSRTSTLSGVDTRTNSHPVDILPGTGLTHPEFFCPPELSHKLPRENVNLTNANWTLPSLNMNGPKKKDVDRGDIHQDEGYVTPVTDLKSCGDREKPYICWENMWLLEDSKSVYSWESCGKARLDKELPFLTESREATDHAWKMIHGMRAQHNQAQVPIALKFVTVQEFECEIKYLLTGIESNIFKFSKEKKSFILQEGVYLKGLSASTLQSYCEDFIQCGNCFRYLTNLLRNENYSKRGNVFKALCNDIQRYLQLYWGIVLHAPPLRSLLHMSEWLQGLRTHLQFLVSLCSRLPKGYALLTHLYNQVPLVSQEDLSFLLYTILQSCCTVYFKILQRWIFEGVCDDKHKEFFILYDDSKCEVLDKSVWNKMYQLNKAMVPSFLKGMEKELLECGRSMALLKMCAPKDPICLELKKGYPGVVCCLNSAQAEALKEECSLYAQRCREHCKQLFDDSSPEITKDEAYYSALRAESYKKIQEAQEQEKQMAADKKRQTFDELKKGMEDAEARKLEYRKSQIEEEERLIQQEEEIYQLNELRKEEEKNKILQYYTAISKAADERKEKAEWKIKRAELYEKRTQFFQESKTLEKLEIDAAKCDLEKQDNRSSTQTSSVNKTSEETSKTEKEPSAIVGSGDFAIDDNSDVTDNARGQLLELTGNIVTRDSIPEVDTTPVESDKQRRTDEERREYMIALEVAEKARQSAARFKERNMFNDYNILTGEETTYESRFFGSKDITEPEETSVKPTSSETSLISVNITELDKMTKTVPTSEVDIEIHQEKADESVLVPNSQLNIPNVQDCAITEFREKGSSLSNKPNASSSHKSDLKMEEIDLTTVYQSLRMSVMIPLLTQQELANEAVLRLLFEKHNLMKHLECIRNYFFLLDGEFGRNLTRQLFTEVQAVDNPNCILSMRLNYLLQSAMGVLSDEEYTQRLSFFIKEVPDAFNLTDAKMLDCLSMRYRTEWPLSAVIHEEMILRFDQTFSFLLKIQRVSWALEQIAYLLKDKRLYDSPQYRQIQLHRHIMTHFIYNLNNYVTTVVLEEPWIMFKNDLSKSKTMAEIITNIKDYCKLLSFRSFHSKRLKSFLEYLVELLSHILFYYELLRRNDWELDLDSGHYVHPRYNELYHHWASFLELVNYLIRYLDIANTRQVFSEFLDKLVTMLCGNQFYRDLVFPKKDKGAQERRKKIET